MLITVYIKMECYSEQCEATVDQDVRQSSNVTQVVLQDQESVT